MEQLKSQSIELVRGFDGGVRSRFQGNLLFGRLRRSDTLQCYDGPHFNVKKSWSVRFLKLWASHSPIYFVGILSQFAEAAKHVEGFIMFCCSESTWCRWVFGLVLDYLLSHWFPQSEMSVAISVKHGRRSHNMHASTA